MNRLVALCMLVLGLIALAGFGVHLAERSGPEKVKAETIGATGFFSATKPKTHEFEAVQKNARSVQIMDLPTTDRSRITGKCALDSGSYFSGWITNGSSWTVKELRFHIAAGQPNGSTRWERNYREQVTLAPRSVGRISFKVAEGRDAETLWTITGARGTPPD